MTLRPSLTTAAAAALIVFSAMPAAFAQERKAIPRLSDGKPDFSGVWGGPGFSHKQEGPGDTDTPTVTRFDRKKMSAFKPGGLEFMARKITGDVYQDDPTAVCLPNGLTRQILSPYSQQFIQTPGKLVILYEYMHFFRVIPTDGSAHDPNAEPTWMGDSVAKWDGDTLVIDSTNLKEWMFDATHNQDGEGSRWHSDQLRLTERLKYISPDLVSYDMTIDDPKIFTAPWTQSFQMKYHPTWKVFEFVCEENNRCEAGKCALSDVQQKNSGK